MTAVTAYLCALEAPGTLAAVGGEEVGAGSPVVAGQGAARVRLVLEVGDNLMTAYMTAVTAYLQEDSIAPEVISERSELVHSPLEQRPGCQFILALCPGAFCFKYGVN